MMRVCPSVRFASCPWRRPAAREALSASLLQRSLGDGKRGYRPGEIVQTGLTLWTGVGAITRLLALVSILLASGCDSLTGVRTLIGCTSGIAVELEEEPPVPYRVEAHAGGGTARYVYECDQTAGCPPMFFAEFTPDWVIFEVIVAVDTTWYEVRPTYTKLRPNGPRCDPTCYNSTIRLPSDAWFSGGS